MKLRHAKTIAATTALLLLTACGGSGDESDDPIEGAETGNEEPRATESPAQTPEQTPATDGAESEIDLPDDVELVFDWETPENPDEAAALAGAADFLRSIAKGVVEQDPDDSTHRGYATGEAREYARTQIGLWVDGGWTMHGTDRFYDAEFKHADSGGSVAVEFCHDDSEMVGKDAETGEVLRPTEYEGDEHLYHYSIVMVETVPRQDFWQASSVTVEEEASQFRA